MAILGSKWAIAVLVFTVAIIVLFLIGKKSVRSEVSIEASEQEIWFALTEMKQIKAWNKVLVPVEGEMTAGGIIKYEFYQEENGKAAVMDANVKQLITNKIINQTGGIPGILTFDHKYIINQSTVAIDEQYRGIMVPFWNPAPVEKAYERLLLQLKKHIENGRSNSH